nr:glycosyltransferase family 2 protein [uncultured Ruminococcus sp.]
MPLVSIVVPVYKVENVLHYCIDSILNQTYKNFELILVDDGSPDNSGKICDEYAKKDNRIKVIHKENGGVSSARNIGIDMADGEYICFVDSDDYMCPTYLYDLIEVQNKFWHSCCVLCGFNVVSDYRRSICKKVIYSNSDELTKLTKRNFIDLYEKWMFQMPWNKLYKLKVIKDEKIFFDENLSLGEDLMFNINYIDKLDGDIIVLNKTLYDYVRSGSESLDNKYYPNLLSIYEYLFGHMIGFSAKLKLSNDDIQRLYNFYFFAFEKILNNTFSKENKNSFIKKYRYNKSILKSKSFKKVLKLSNCNINPIIKWLYEHELYLIIKVIKILV